MRTPPIDCEWVQILIRFQFVLYRWNYSVVIMTAMASQITGVSIVYSTVCSDADKKTIKAPRHWPLWEEFTAVTDEFPTQRASNAENFSIDDVIMDSCLLHIISMKANEFCLPCIRTLFVTETMWRTLTIGQWWSNTNGAVINWICAQIGSRGSTHLVLRPEYSAGNYV